MAISANQIKELKRFDNWAIQVQYWRTHLDVFIEEYFGVKLTTVQKVQARAFGLCDEMFMVQSRGSGKTWLTCVCCLAIGVLYPFTKVAVVSGTAEQATLVIRKIDDYFCKLPNVAREIEFSGKRAVSPMTRNKSVCRLKNGSILESFSLGTFRGNRAKVIVVDEAPEVSEKDLQEIVKPVRNYTRDHCIQVGIEDYPSKMISITSACLKSNYFYDAFVKTLKIMGDEYKVGKPMTKFVCALSYMAAVHGGITKAQFFEDEKASMTESAFAMEYGSIFLGAEAGSMFPFELTDKCRVLVDVETSQPSRSTSTYIMGLDLATSNKSWADNTVVSIIKLVERDDGNYLKKLVYMQSFNGKRLDTIANEVRKLIVRFPNIEKVVFDFRGLGDALPEFFNQPWTDPDTNKEYPPLVSDTDYTTIKGAIPLLHPVIATQNINQQLVNCLTIALERELIQLPINSRRIIGNHIAVDEDPEEDKEVRKLTKAEKAIFLEADTLQIEMGNVVGRESGAGRILYDVAKAGQHKDRYSSLAMAVWYISAMEESNKAFMRANDAFQAVGVVSSF